ncbi:MAG: FlgD immunoglobulin-like domain containing protein, partial [Candidatus Eisenbacteria bacterium]|nr:FlgD immunoglobulin-like domain containing protein [Candidatus Eisenbacteria bacterium]
WSLWCHYELCLLGDPALPQWGSSRGTLSLLHTGAFTMGQEAYSVRVLCNGLPVAQAAVTIWADDLSTAVTGQTNAQGVVLLSPTPNYPAPLHVKAVKLDYLPGEGTIAVDPGQQPWIVWGATSLDDDGAGASIGDGDGEADAGERIEMYLSLENIGHIASTALTVTVSCDNPHVTIEQGQAGYDPIAGGQSGENLTPFLVRIAPDAIDGESTRWTAEITDGGQRIWIEEFDLTLHAPILSLASWSIEDQANGDGEGDIDPNEPFLLHVVLHNSGSDGAREISATLTANTSDVALPVAESGLASLPASGSAELDPPFAGSVSASIPTEGFVHFEIAMTTWCGQPFQAAFDARIDSYVEDLFETESGWTAGAPGDDALRGFWVRVDPVGTWRNGRIVQTEDDHTPEGTFCFVTGNGNPGDQAPVSDIDGGRTTLLSPVYDLSGAIDPRLVYWRWYTNNEGFNGNQDWWVVEITDDGGASWVSLENTTESETAWRRMEFRLADYVDPAAHVQVRFMASDEGYDSIVEAGVDDFSIESVLGPAGAESPALEPVRFGIRSIAPNPAAGAPGAGQTIAIEFALEEAAPYRVGVYDVTGALVRAYEGAAQPAGVRRILFDGRDRRGHPLAGGIYFVRLQSQEREASGKLILLGR